MKNISVAKSKLRSEIASAKSKYSPEELIVLSQDVLLTLEITDIFQKANNIFIYNSLKDEVQTTNFIEKWAKHKTFFLPVVEDNNLVFRKYSPACDFNTSSLGIKEPCGDNFTDYKKIDLVIVPGVAFDRNKNRLGRGKGYYDRFLPKITAPKVGICFDFQLKDQIPADINDVKMDYIVSENDLIW